jgi:large subunit ribosomal protein L6
MSRVGKRPIEIPSGVKASVASGTVTVEGPKGKLDFKLGADINVVVEQGKILLSPVVSGKGEDSIADEHRARFGTARALINNMVTGVSKGWKRSLELNGVGFTAKLQGQVLTLAVGFSHDVVFDLPKEIKCSVTKNTIDLESADRQLVGNYAARIRKTQPPEPYLGKGIKYAEEKVRRKAGKTGKK